MFAYLNSSNDVIASSKVERTLAEAQERNPDIDEIIVGAPNELIVKGVDQAELMFHRYAAAEGDGTEISDYTEIEYFDDYKAARKAEIDLRTEELLKAGVSFGGTRFFITDSFLIIYIGLLLIPEESFPLPILFADLYGKQFVFTDRPTFLGLYTAAQTALMTIRIGGVQLRGAIDAASTKAEIDAIQDTRTEQ